MNADAYDQAVKAVKDAGLAIEKQAYHQKSFGSWYIVVATTPPRRLVWDGKEGWYVVEEETSETFNGFPLWKELWIDRNPEIHTVQIGVEKLCAATGHSIDRRV